MINLPDFNKAFEYENNFYLSCDNSRIAKIISHYELYKMVEGVPGAIVECGVFKGTSLIRFAAFQDLFGKKISKKIIGFDIFGKYPETNFLEDKGFRERFVKAAGSESISKEQLTEVLKNKGINNLVELIEGDITKTVPAYLASHPNLEISLLNLDVDIYEPSVIVLKYLYPRIVKNGVLILDDYGVFPGETKAVDDYFKDKEIKIERFSFCKTPVYIVKKE
jgi:hypothetical protein